LNDHGRHGRDAEAKALPKPGKALDVAGTAVSEAEVSAHANVTCADARRQLAFCELLIAHLRKRGVEANLEKALNPFGRESAGALGAALQSEGRRHRLEEPPRVRLENRRRQRSADRLRLGARCGDHCAVSDVHAVEIAEREYSRRRRGRHQRTPYNVGCDASPARPRSCRPSHMLKVCFTENFLLLARPIRNKAQELPVTNAAGSPHPDPAACRYEERRLTNPACSPVPVVDDYNTMIRVVRSLSRKLGFVQVEEASDGPAALAKLRAGDYARIVAEELAPTRGA
jgi:hypothetical protein